MNQTPQERSLSLDEIATRLAANLDTFQSLARRTVECAWNIGDCLVQAKASPELPHGSWLPWLKERGIGERTSRNFMALRSNYDTIGAASIFRSPTEALAALSGPSKSDSVSLLPDDPEASKSANIADLTDDPEPEQLAQTANPWDDPPPQEAEVVAEQVHDDDEAPPEPTEEVIEPEQEVHAEPKPARQRLTPSERHMVETDELKGHIRRLETELHEEQEAHDTTRRQVEAIDADDRPQLASGVEQIANLKAELTACKAECAKQVQLVKDARKEINTLERRIKKLDKDIDTANAKSKEAAATIDSLTARMAASGDVGA